MTYHPAVIDGPNGACGVWCCDGAIIAVSAHFDGCTIPAGAGLGLMHGADIGDTYFAPLPENYFFSTDNKKPPAG